ncbi:MAG TPA: hypothetical protein DCY53_12650 [Desulfobacteraceae bacterium]|nr:hypothetical protein [Desulfobacteraceae bacterium]
MRRCNHNIRKTLNLVDEMIRVADKGDIEREDSGCGILYGVLRDSAYKVKKLAEQEKEKHIEKGWWTEESES